MCLVGWLVGVLGGVFGLGLRDWEGFVPFLFFYSIYQKMVYINHKKVRQTGLPALETATRWRRSLSVVGTTWMETTRKPWPFCRCCCWGGRVGGVLVVGGVERGVMMRKRPWPFSCCWGGRVGGGVGWWVGWLIGGVFILSTHARTHPPTYLDVLLLQHHPPLLKNQHQNQIIIKSEFTPAPTGTHPPTHLYVLLLHVHAPGAAQQLGLAEDVVALGQQRHGVAPLAQVVQLVVGGLGGCGGW